LPIKKALAFNEGFNYLTSGAAASAGFASTGVVGVVSSDIFFSFRCDTKTSKAVFKFSNERSSLGSLTLLSIST
jgi:hypothetical protein